MTETEYFSDYERRALNTSLDEDHVDIIDAAAIYEEEAAAAFAAAATEEHQPDQGK